MVTSRRAAHARGRGHAACRARRTPRWPVPALLAPLALLVSAPGRGAALSLHTRATPPVAPLVSRAPAVPPYYIEALRARRYPGGALALGSVVARGAGFITYRMTWPSGGQTMTGSITIPDGRGPFPVVVVAHGYVPAAQYAVGQDAWRYGDALAARGFIAAAPDYPGYAGSGPGPAGMPETVAIAVTVLDLVGSLRSLPRADTARIALLGHSQGGEVALLAMVVDPRIRAVALFAPDSSDAADNVRRWGADDPAAAGPLGSPDRNPTGYAHVSPRRYFRRVGPPVLLVQGTADEQIPAAWTTATYRALRRAGARTKLMWVPGAHHILAGTDLATANTAAATWMRQSFERTLVPRRPADP